jgi:acid phosphatase family membrane protein YuiD
VYVVAVWLDVGQEVDDVGFEARKSIELGVRRALTWGVRVGTLLFLFAGCVAIAWLSWRRRAAVAGLAVAASVGVVAVAARLLKGLLPRPELMEFSWAGGHNSFPSGHSATVMAMSLGLVGLVWTSERGRCAAIMSILVGTHTLGMVCSGWHRPSDVLAGLLIGAAAAVLVVPLVVRVDGSVERTVPWYLRTPFVARTLGGVAAALVVLLLPLRHTPAVAGRSFLVFLALAPTLCLVAALLVIAHARRCHRATSDPSTVMAAPVTATGPGPAAGTSHRPPS